MKKNFKLKKFIKVMQTLYDVLANRGFINYQPNTFSKLAEHSLRNAVLDSYVTIKNVFNQIYCYFATLSYDVVELCVTTIILKFVKDSGN